MKNTMKRFLTLMLVLAMVLSCVPVYGFAAETGNVAKVGNTEYATIDEAIAAWTNNTTLTLLADVTLTDVVKIKSTEHHILNLGTYTLTAASGKNAFEIVASGTGSDERYAITIKADATNPGGINAGKKAIIYYDYSKGTATGDDRPIIKIEGGHFTASTSTLAFGSNVPGIYTKGSAARKCATLNISGGTFDCAIVGSVKSKLIITGGNFNYSVGSQGDSTANRLISGGRFKTLGFMTADSNNTKFWFGTSMGNSNVGLYVDNDGYLNVGGPVITELSSKYVACASNATKWSSYLQYSSAATYGLYYTDADMAIAKHGELNVSIYEKPPVTIPEDIVDSIVGEDATAEEKAAVEEVVKEIQNNTALNNVPPQYVPAGAELVITLSEVDTESGTIVYDVAPMADGAKVENLTEAIVFRLPVPASVTMTYAKVYHEGELMGLYEIKGEGNAKYVEITSADFSKYAVEPIDEAVAIGNATYATLADAVKAIPKGATATPTTITLLKDQKISSLMVGHQYTQNVIVDLNGFTLSSSAIVLTAYRGGTTLEVKNGTIIGNSTSGTLRATYGGKLVLGDDLTVKGAGGSATLIYVDNGSLEIKAKEGVDFVGGKLDFKQSTNVNNKLYVVAGIERTYFGSLADAIAAVQDGGTVTVMGDSTADQKIVIEKNVTIDGNGYTLTYTGDDRAIEVPMEANGANVTISKLDIVAESAQRGINYNTNGKLTLNNVNVTLNKSKLGYALNVPTYGDNGTIEINGGKLYGGIALNIWGSDMTINVNNAELVSEETDPNFEYAAIQLNRDDANGHIADGTIVTVNGGSISATNQEGEPSLAVSNWTTSGEVIISEETEVLGEHKYAVAWVAGACCYTLQDALDEVVEKKINAPIELLRDISASEIITIPDGIDITLDGKGYTLTSTAARAINVESSCNVTIKNLTINCSGERAVNVIKMPATLTLDNVTATAFNYTLNVATSAGAAKVTVNNSTLNGLCTVNIAGAGADVKLTDSTINCNDNNTTQGEAYAALCLIKDATNAKITADRCTINVTEGSDSEVARNGAEGGSITIDGSSENVKTPVAYRDLGDYYYSYESLRAAIDNADSGDTIVLLNDIKLDADDLVDLDGYHTFFKIEGKSITIDLNGKTIYADASTVTDKFVVGVFSATNGGNLILKDSKGTGTVQGYSGKTQEAAYLDPTKGNWDYNYKFYSLLVVYDDECSITVEGGNYILDYAGDSLAYTSCSEGIVVNGGTFKLGNLGGIRNGMPWVFNARGQNGRHVVVNAGTFCADIQHQYYCFEVSIAKELALKYKDGMYTVVPAVAYVTEREWCCAWYTNEVGYATLEEAIAACEGPTTITYYKKPYTSEQEVVVLLENVELTDSVTVAAGKSVILDLNGKTISQTKEQTGAYSMIANNGNLTIIDSVGGGKISYTDSGNGGEYVSNTVLNGGTLTVKGGTIENLSSATVAKNGYPQAIDNNGALIVEKGTVSCANYSAIRIWCTTDDNTSVVINGGNFYGSIDLHNVNGNANKGTLTINGGTFDQNDFTSKVIRLVNFGKDVEGLSIIINDGAVINGDIGISGSIKEDALLDAVLTDNRTN